MLYSKTKLHRCTRRETSTVPSFIVKQPQVCNLFWCFLRGLRVRGVTPNTQWIKNSIWDNVISIWVGFHTTKFLALRVGKNRSAQKHHSKACNTTSLHFSSSHQSSLPQTWCWLYVLHIFGYLGFSTYKTKDGHCSNKRLSTSKMSFCLWMVYLSCLCW